MRICSLLPSATEMLYAIGAGRWVVGRSQHCAYPPSVRRKPILVKSRVKKIARNDSLAIHHAVVKLKEKNGHQFEVDAELLSQLRPDLVVGQTLCNVCAASHSEVEEALAKLDSRPQVVNLQANTLSQVFADLKTLGEVTGRQAAAAQVVRRLQRRLDGIERRLKSVDTRPRVWCCEWLQPLMAAGHWIPEMVGYAVGQDGLGHPGANSVWLTWEQIRSYDPEVIVVMPCSYSIAQTLREKERLTGRPGWKHLSAVKRGKVSAVNGAFFHHAGPRLVNGVELLAHLLHSDRVPAGPYRGYFRTLV